MHYVISISDDSDRKFYFAGWEGSDTHPEARNAIELTYWRPTAKDPETYDYDDLDEAELEVKLLMSSIFEDAIGLPIDFHHDIVKMRIEQVKVGSYG